MKHGKAIDARRLGALRELAEQAAGQAADGSPTRAAQSETRAVVSMAALLPTAKAMLHGEASAPSALADRQALADQLQTPRARVNDGLGHSRPVYRLLALWLLQRSGAKLRPMGVEPGEGDVACVLWSALLDADATASVAVVESVLNEPGRDGALHVLGRDDLLDAWTYRELVGLHALMHLADRHGRDDWRARRDEIAEFHQGHTQPDYTTYQPWALAAFLGSWETVMFAEQQMHDTATHLAIEGGPGAVVPAVLLADAVATLETER